MSTRVRWILYGLAGVVIGGLVLLAAGTAAAWWTRYPGLDAPRAPATVIEGGERFAPARDTVLENARIVVDGERIACVGDTCAVPEDARRIDASGHAVLPGLIDLHVHMDAPAGDALNAAVPPAAMMWSYVRHRPGARRAFLTHGVTTIRSVGDPIGHRFGILRRQSQIRRHALAGPRLLTAGPTVTAPEGHPAGTIYEGNDWLISHATRQVARADTARARIQGLADRGVDGIKVIYEAGSPEEPLPRLGRTVMEAVVDEARTHNLWVAAHTSSAEEARHVLATGGVRTIEHGAHQDTLLAETIEQMNTQDVILVPTLAVLDARTEAADSSRAPLRTSMYNVRRAHEAGVSIGAGTDTQGQTMHFGRSLHRELELLVEAGLSPRDALRGATSRAARALHSDDLGRIAPGARADVLIVSGRPWQDIRDARNVQIVLKDGRVLVSEDET